MLVLGGWRGGFGGGFWRRGGFLGVQDCGKRAVRTVRVRNISDLATEREVREFFSFSGEIEHVDIRLW
jgi:hypothetical protein